MSRVLKEREERTAASTTTAEVREPDPYTILLVDDDEAILKVISRTLVDLGYTVLTAGDGESAVEIYRQQHEEIDAVVLDYSMPKMSGGGAFTKMREIDPSVRVLLATGHGRTDEVQELLDSGVDGLLSKPYGTTELIRWLAKRGE